MEKKDLEIYLKKRARLILKSGYNYNGYVISVGDDCVRIRDKYHKIVIISLDQISLIEDREEDGG